MINQFRIGDTVRLKSGGPLMTVIFLQDNLVNCTWFLNDELKEIWFPTEALELSA